MPDEMLNMCFSDLELQDLLSSRNVCKQWKHIASEVDIKVKADWLYDEVKGTGILPRATVQKIHEEIDNKNGITKIYSVYSGIKTIHCDDGPALYSEVCREYYRNGILHRSKNEGPAVEYDFSNADNNDYDFNSGYYNSIDLRKKLSYNGKFEEYWENGFRIYPINPPSNVFKINMSMLDNIANEQTPRGAMEIDYIEEARRISQTYKTERENLILDT